MQKTNMEVAATSVADVEVVAAAAVVGLDHIDRTTNIRHFFENLAAMAEVEVHRLLSGTAGMGRTSSSSASVHHSLKVAHRRRKTVDREEERAEARTAA
jgi:hypothetical protein